MAMFRAVLAAALVLAASFASARAEDDRASAPLTAYLQSLGQNSGSIAEGRQAAPAQSSAVSTAISPAEQVIIDRSTIWSRH